MSTNNLDIVRNSITKDADIITPTTKINGLKTNDKNFWWLIGKYIADGWLFKRKIGNDYRIIIAFEKDQDEIKEFEDKIKNLYH